MAKLLKIKDLVLLLSATVGEIANDLRLVGDVIPELMRFKYGYIPPNYKRDSYLSSVSKLLSTGEINKKINKDGLPYLELTNKGQEKFKRNFPILSLQKRKWDGLFTIISFDIKEKDRYKRDVLRSKLKELGFGQLQESVWISPYHFEEDFREFIDSKNMGEYVYIFRAKVEAFDSYKNLIKKVWNLDFLDSEYQAILDKIDEKTVNLEELWQKYFSTVLKDPMLPDEICPSDWKRGKVLKTLQNLHDR